MLSLTRSSRPQPRRSSVSGWCVELDVLKRSELLVCFFVDIECGSRIKVCFARQPAPRWRGLGCAIGRAAFALATPPFCVSIHLHRRLSCLSLVLMASLKLDAKLDAKLSTSSRMWAHSSDFGVYNMRRPYRRAPRRGRRDRLRKFVSTNKYKSQARKH